MLSSHWQRDGSIFLFARRGKGRRRFAPPDAGHFFRQPMPEGLGRFALRRGLLLSPDKGWFSLAAGERLHPPFLFALPKRKAPWTVEKKRALF